MAFKYERTTSGNSRKRDYTTFTRDVEEGDQEVINLEDDTSLPRTKKQKRKVTVIDFTQVNDDENDDLPIFSPASEQLESRPLTCMSCSETKQKDFSTATIERDGSSLGGAICCRCWEENFSAEQEVYQAKIKERECSICYDTSPLHLFPKTPHEGAREHTVCISCWEQHLHAEVERRAWDGWICPQSDCGKFLTYGEIAVLDERFERAIEPILAIKATTSYLQQERTYFACPSGTCPSGVFLDGDPDHQEGSFVCEACDAEFCLACKVPMHTGLSCEDFQESLHGDSRRRRQEAKSKNVLDRKYKTLSQRRMWE